MRFGRKNSGEEEPLPSGGEIQAALREITARIDSTIAEAKSLFDDFRSGRMEGPDYTIKSDILSARLANEKAEKSRLLAQQDRASRELGRKALGDS